MLQKQVDLTIKISKEELLIILQEQCSVSGVIIREQEQKKV